MRALSSLLALSTSLSLCGFEVRGGTIEDDAPYRTLQFTANITHRTNLCDRQQLLRTGDIDFLDVLRELELSVALAKLPGPGDRWINYDEINGDFVSGDPGYHIEILDELASRAGFSWRNSYGVILPLPSQGAFRLQPNATTNDLLSWAVNAYDFSFTSWDRTIERMRLGVDFPFGFQDSSTILIARNTMGEKKTFDFTSFLRPFNWAVWACIVVTIVLTGLIYRWVSKIYSIGQSTMQSRDKNVSEHVQGVNIFYAALTATGHMEFSPVTFGERILVLSLSFWSLVIAATYTANLASVMISKSQSQYPATSLSEAQRKGLSICVARGLATANKLKTGYPNVRLVESEGLTAMYEDLIAKKCDLVSDAASTFEVTKLNGTLNQDCSLEWVGRAVDISSAGPANIVDVGIYCTSLVGHVFEYYLKDMQRDGFLERAFRRHVTSMTTHSCPEGEDTSSADSVESDTLTMLDMGAIFLAHGVACIVGLLVSYLQRYSGLKAKDHGETINFDGNVQGLDNVDDGDGAILSVRQIVSGEWGNRHPHPTMKLDR